MLLAIESITTGHEQPLRNGGPFSKRGRGPLLSIVKLWQVAHRRTAPAVFIASGKSEQNVRGSMIRINLIGVELAATTG